MKAKIRYKKYEVLRINIRDLIRSVTKKSDDYDEKYMIIKFDTDEKLLLNKRINVPIIIIVVRAVFNENNKHYLQVILDECLYEIEMEHSKFKKPRIKNHCYYKIFLEKVHLSIS